MKQLRILIVDDDRDFAESMAELVEMNGHEAVLAFNGLSAIKIFKQNNIDLILMDIRMLGLNGVETLKEVNKYNPDIPVAMMTGYSDQPLLDLALKQGVISILNKPVNLEQLKNIFDIAKHASKILLLDDDKDFADSLYEILCIEGYKVSIAYSIEEALQYAQNNVIDILLLDLRLNGKSGIDLWYMLKDKGINIPVIFLTGYAEQFTEQIEKIRCTTKVQVMRKPVAPKELIKMMDAIG